MSPERMRVAVLAIASILLLVAGTFLLGWHVGDMRIAGMTGTVAMKLRSMEVCVTGQGCVAVEFGSNPALSGLYPTFGSIVYFGSIAFALLVAWQGATRVLSGYASPSLSKGGYGVGMLLFGGAVACGYILGDSGSVSEAGVHASIGRGWGPLAQLAGLALGIAALYHATLDTYDDAYQPGTPVLPAAKLVSPPASVPIPTTKSETGTPEALRGKLRFLAITAELTRGGIDARREDGTTALVMWRDVVGAVARRLPDALEGAAIVDIVSTAGSTLRIAPWTRLAGDPLNAGAGEDDRMRALLRLVSERCPNAKLDRATREFLDTPRERPMQLPDPETLAEHDARLA